MPTVTSENKAEFDRAFLAKKNGSGKFTNEDKSQDSVHPMGINVATDVKNELHYADLIVDGQKKYESRETDSLRPYVGKHISIVRTGEGKAKAIGSAFVGEPLIVDEEKFRQLESQHKVQKGSKFDIKSGQTKYLYPMSKAVRYKKEYDVEHGIVARKVIKNLSGDND